MKIDLLETAGLLHGIACVTRTENGFALKRMTPELLNFYGNTEYEIIRANCLAGVRLCFSSNTDTVKMGLKFGRYTRMIYTTDVIIDKVRMVTFDPETGCDPYTFTLENTEPGEHIYEIWLPNMCEAEITFLEIDDGASLYPVLHSGSPVIAIGDSITQGMTSSSPSRCYAALLSKALKRDLFNLSVGGAEMKKEVGSLALAYNWSSAIVAFGVNDYFHKRPLADFEADTRGILQALSTREHANSYIITPIPCMQTAENTVNTLEDFRQCIRQTAADFPQTVVIEGTKLLPHDPKYYIDGAHPNDAGMQIMAEKLYKKITAIP